jgi:hypothetical protein
MSTFAVNAITDNNGGNTATINSYTPTESNMAGRNRIINGELQVSQRGNYTSATAIPTSSTYYLDRFRFRRNGVTGNFIHKLNQTLDNNDVVNTVRLDVTSTATGRVEILQIIEDFNWFKNKTITFSAQVKSNSTDARLVFNADGGGGTTASTAHTGGGGWERLTGTATLTSGVTGVQLYLGIQAAGTGDVAGVTSGDFFEVSEIQLEAGYTATPFEHRMYGQELVLCQRYYEVGSNSSSGGFIGAAGVSLYSMTCYKATKRSAVTFTTTNCQSQASGGTVTNRTFGTSANDTQGFNPLLAGSDPVCYITWQASAEL